MLVVLVDALDEATRDGRNVLAAFLASEFDKLPSWLRLVITSRPDPEVMYPLQALSAHTLDADTPANRDDIRVFLRHELRSHLLDIRNADDFVEQILDISEGNFLYVEWVRREVLAGRLSLAEAGALPKGLGGVYAQFATRQWPDHAAFKKEIGPTLDLVAAAREPLPLTLLAEIGGWSDRQQNEFEAKLGSLFELRDGRILPFHKSLLDWLTDRARAGPYFVSAADGERQLAEFCGRQFERNPLELSDYARGHLPAHLAADKRWDALETVLIDLGFLEGKTERSGIFAVAADFAAALSKLPPGRPLEQTLRLLEEAIRRELHFIGRHPTTLFQCLWNLCWWFDSPETAAHYDAGSFPAPGPGPKLHVLLERWRREKQARQPGFVWVRSLRPPALPLGAHHLVLGGHSDNIHAAASSADGRRLVSASRDSTVRLWDTDTGAELFRWKTAGPVYAAALSPDGSTVAAAAPVMDKIVILWDARTGKLLKTMGPHTGEIQCVAFSPDGRHVAAGSDEASVVIWNIASGERVALLVGGTNRTESVEFSPDGSTVLSGGGWGVRQEQYLRLWDWRARTQLRVITAHRSLLHRVTFAPDVRRFASCAGDASGDYTIKVWSGESDAPLVLGAHRGSVDDIGFSPDGCRLVSGSWDETVRLWDVASGEQMLALNIGSKVNCVGFLADRRIYTAGYDNVVRIWDSLGTIVAPPPRPDGRDNLWRIAYSPDGSILLTGSEGGEVKLWDATSGRLLRICKPWVQGPVNNVAFSPDSSRVAIGTGYVPWGDEDDPWAGRSDYGVRIFAVAKGEIIGVLDVGAKVSPRALRYSADGRTIIAPLEVGRVGVWDAASLKLLEELAGERAVTIVTPFRSPAPEYARFDARLQGPETIFFDRTNGQDIAWLSQPLHSLTPRPGGGMWAGCSDQVNAHGNESRKIDIVAVEGSPGNASSRQ
jgi:WD40 repeat protein